MAGMKCPPWEWSKVAIHFAPPTTRCSMERCKNNGGRRSGLSAHISGIGGVVCRPRLNVESTWRDFDGQLDFGARSVIRKTSLGLRAETAYVAKVVGATFPSREVPYLRGHASRYETGITPCADPTRCPEEALSLSKNLAQESCFNVLRRQMSGVVRRGQSRATIALRLRE